MNTYNLRLSEAQMRALRYCLDTGRMELEQTEDDEKWESGLGYFERSIEAIEAQLDR